MDPTPLPEGDNKNGSPKLPPIVTDPKQYQRLFKTTPAKGQWLGWIEALLSDVPVASVITDLDQLMALCDQASATFDKESNVLNVVVDEGDDLILVGDVHGQFKDFTTHILSIQLEKYQKGEPDAKFLFLGDYVDRGPQSAEVLTLLLCLKVEYPQLVHMIRGNHEEFQTCRIYGFSHECSSKFKDVRPFAKFNSVFTSLPLAAVVTAKAGSFFCCHGGLSPKLDLVESIQFVNRSEYEGGMDDNGEIVDGLLWSDPMENGFFMQNARGCGFLFGQEATNAFLTTNNLKFMVRAHQLAMQGWSWEHNKKVLTVFSAPNYCGINGNQGAIFVVHGNAEDYENLDLRSYSAVDSAPPLFKPKESSPKPVPDANAAGSYFDNADIPASPTAVPKPIGNSNSSEDPREALL